MSGGYELHQKLRTKAVRQIKKKDYDGAVESLYDGARQLLEAKEQGSGCDLACYLIDVYQQAQTPSTDTSRERIVKLVSLAASDFWRKKVIDAAIRWSAKVTETPAGDGHLRLAFGEILSKEADFYNAEPHYIAACSPPPAFANLAYVFPPDAPKAFASMMLAWLEAYGKDVVAQHKRGDPATVEQFASGSFALRGLLPLLVARALTASRSFLSAFTSQLVQRHAALLLSVQPNPKPYAPPAGMSKPSGEAQQLYLTKNAELNFAQMTLAMAATAVEHKKATKGSRVPEALSNSWIAAIQQFHKELQGLRGEDDNNADNDEEDEYFDQVIPILSKTYFDIQPQRNANPNFMQDMLGSLLGGGGGQDAGNRGAAATVVQIKHAPPPALPKKALEAATAAGTTSAAADQAGEEELDLD